MQISTVMSQLPQRCGLVGLRIRILHIRVVGRSLAFASKSVRIRAADESSVQRARDYLQLCCSTSDIITDLALEKWHLRMREPLPRKAGAAAWLLAVNV